MSAESRIRVERIYEDIDPDDRQRVLVDRIRPRGKPRGGAREVAQGR
jgi:uncharacterized protein YeaO (DUF488 family)